MTADTAPEPLNNQTAFDTIIRHLRKQGRPATNSEGRCMYRSPTGLSCAVGCLIPDSEYDPDFEDLSATGISYRIPALSGVEDGLLGTVQTLHDSWTPTPTKPFEKTFESELRGLAAAYNLDPAVLDEEAQTND